MAKLRFPQIVDERLDRREQDRLRIAEQTFVMFELVELVGERLDLLHLVVDHLDELGDFLRCIENPLNVACGVIDDPLRACGDRDAECDECECDEFLHGVSFVISLFAGRRQHTANHEKGFTTGRRREDVCDTQNAGKSVKGKTKRHCENQHIPRIGLAFAAAAWASDTTP